MFYNVFNNTFPIFLITFLGIIIRHKWLKSEEFWRGIEKLSFFLLLPAVLLDSTSKINLAASDLVRLIIALILSTSLVAAFLVYYQAKHNYDKIQFTSVFQGGIRYNSYIFFALGSALFGNEGLIIISVVAPCMIIFVNTLAVIVFAHYIPKKLDSNNNSLIIIGKSIYTNPLIISSIVGLLFNYFDIKLNVGISKTIASLAQSAFAIGLMIVGASLRLSGVRAHWNQIFFASVIKLIVLPIVTFIVLWLMAITGIEKSIGILYSCLPCATTSYLLSRQLGGDPETMTSIITFSTVFSLLSLSVLVYILG